MFEESFLLLYTFPSTRDALGRKTESYILTILWRNVARQSSSCSCFLAGIFRIFVLLDAWGRAFRSWSSRVQVCAPTTGPYSAFFLILSTGGVSPEEGTRSVSTATRRLIPNSYSRRCSLAIRTQSFVPKRDTRRCFLEFEADQRHREREISLLLSWRWPAAGRMGDEGERRSRKEKRCT